MKKLTYVVSIVLTVVVGTKFINLNNDSNKNNISKESIKTTKIPSRHKSGPAYSPLLSRNLKNIQATVKNNSSIHHKLEKMHQDAMRDFANSLKNAERKIKQLGLDPKIVFKDLEKLGPIKFTEGIPEELKAVFSKVSEEAKKAQQLMLELDGKSSDDIKPYEVYTPTWIEQRQLQLAEVSLSGDLNSFLERKAKEASISDDDVMVVINTCNKDKDCIEKSFMTLISANHQLSAEQFEIIKKYI